MATMDEFMQGKKTKLSAQELGRGERAIPKGPVEKKVYGNYYDIDNTITTAQLTAPNDPDVTTYNREPVFESLERNAEIIEVSNDNPLGGAIIYAISSHSGKQGFSRERPIYPQQIKVFYNIYEIRLRSALAGSPYRITEYDIETTM